MKVIESWSRFHAEHIFCRDPYFGPLKLSDVRSISQRFKFEPKSTKAGRAT